jgi:hypothetical protein
VGFWGVGASGSTMMRIYVDEGVAFVANMLGGIAGTGRCVSSLAIAHDLAVLTIYGELLSWLDRAYGRILHDELGGRARQKGKRDL